MSDEAPVEPTAGGPQRATGSLKASTGSLDAAAPVAPPDRGARVPLSSRALSTRIAETVIYLLAVVGAVAVGLGISNYLSLHPYVYAYLIAYAAFRIADLLVRDESMLGNDPAHFAHRVKNELPVLLMFAAAPLERSYYTGDAPNWLAGLGILIELLGLWLVLGARIQLGFYSAGATSDEAAPIVRNGLYRYIRHPTYVGDFLVLFAWPFQYAAPVTLVVVVLWGAYILRRRIKEEEAEMLAYHGDEYAAYMRATDAIIPNVW
jgi:protein-S-isoprenylcysteine O-methyltransferase Ste14